MSAHGFDLPTSSKATFETAAALSNTSNRSFGNGNGTGTGSADHRTPTASASAAVAAAATSTTTPAAVAAALLPARRPRHQITRSITEFSPPIRMHRHRHSHHHHHHTTTTTNRRDDRASPGLSVADKGLVLGRSSLDMTRSEFATPSRSPDSSRRTSALLAPLGGGEIPATLSPPRAGRRRVVNAAALLEEKEKTASRVSGLRKSLGDLSGFSTTTTRHLDETYYSVLEKKSMLQNTVSAIKELAIASRKLTDDFEREAGDMVGEVDGQLGGLGLFNEQESRIETLQSRIETGRTRVQGLSERVDVVRRRIEGWERADREWQEKTRKRLRTVWIVTSVVFAVLLLLFAGVQYAQSTGAVDVEAAADQGLKAVGKGLNRSAEGLGIGSGKPTAGGGGGGQSAGSVPPLWEGREGGEEDDQLRVFDEL
ncbi:hypothetical protein C8035_v000179 [Colletotrichum spinosum]|uniref:Uncharacterized protein n=1 Tax=Colletotrichum spinosum TaxID=1347390 RepID=A0A4R8PUM7_9PEZI|nr:hypothetical protein C8035_v000179 [Colletotrichum spinosum]